MKFNLTEVDENRRDELARAIRWCHKHRDLFAGLPYQDRLAGPGGIHLEILVTKDIPLDQIRRALYMAHTKRDVVSYAVLICPADWFVQEKEAIV